MQEKQTILFLVIDGAGLGHTTRALAIAKKLRSLAPEVNIVFLTTSLVPEIIKSQGFIYSYIPPKWALGESVSATTWLNMLAKQLDQMVALYEPKGIVFEGACPYRGITSKFKNYTDIKSIWIKRESYREEAKVLDQNMDYFQLVITPKEAGQDYEQALQKVENRQYCNPITIIDDDEAYSRGKARKLLGIEKGQIAFYVQLGAGRINDIVEPLEVIQRSLLNKKNVKIILAQSMVGEPLKVIDSRIDCFKDYPNAKYFKGIDFAISAAGYNTLNELVQFQVPTLFIPNMETVVDDQVKRVTNLLQNRAALCLRNISEIDYMVKQLELKKKEISRNLARCKNTNGAIEAAKLILDQLTM